MKDRDGVERGMGMLRHALFNHYLICFEVCDTVRPLLGMLKTRVRMR